MKTAKPTRKVTSQAIWTGIAIVACWSIFYYGLLPAETPDFVRREVFNVINLTLLAIGGALTSLLTGYMTPPAVGDQVILEGNTTDE